MHFLQVPVLLALAATGVFANLHEYAVCVNNRVERPIGGTGWSVSYTWSKTYDVDDKATQCACRLYRNRLSGKNWWDSCPDCVYDVNQKACHSAGKHIGGDEMTHYCSKNCGAQGAEAS